jgi:hypothetical protein
MNVPGYGLCWRPAVAATDPYWRPYCDSGYWLYTADGWYWQSDYPWGDIVFHYGRFFVGGIGRDRIVVLTHHEIRIGEPVHHEEFRGRVEVDRHGFHDDHRDRHGW